MRGHPFSFVNHPGYNQSLSRPAQSHQPPQISPHRLELTDCTICMSSPHWSDPSDPIIADIDQIQLCGQRSNYDKAIKTMQPTAVCHVPDSQGCSLTHYYSLFIQEVHGPTGFCFPQFIKRVQGIL